MSTQYQKLLALLKELFQTDQAELDFGIYRVINQRRDEINRFLDEELLPQVKNVFSEFNDVDKGRMEDDLAKAIEEANRLEVDPYTSGKVKRIRERIATYSLDVDDLENQVYSNLYNFFRRYYDDGDFISQRRYKEGVYAIPYEGEEVKLYWANHDQYYIKTSEYFRDYSFKLPSGKRAHFKLVEADTEKDNRKEIDDNKRRFVLAEEPLAWRAEEVVIRFEFRPEKANQSSCNEQTLGTIFGVRNKLTEQAQKDALTELAQPAPTESNPNRTLLEKHLEDYTRRNTQDYFIHKDLGKFLRRELDFYIKNEIMHLDNIENESVPRVEEYLSKIKVIRQVAHKIIDFLAQIEDFQKKLWLKKKFVIETNYCITLDRIPEEFYPEITANEAQHEEWVRLFAIDEINNASTTVNSNPLTIEFLKENPFLIVDTKLFSKEFKCSLLNCFNNLDNDLDGVLIHSENFQALNLIQNYYKNDIDTIYIDPPYNTVHSEILYKNQFKHSSWLSLIANTIEIIPILWNSKFSLGIAIDDFEFVNLAAMLDSKFPDLERSVVVVNHHPQGAGGRLSRTHEYLILLSSEDDPTYLGKPKEDYTEKRNFMRSGTAENNFRYGRWKSFYALLLDPRLEKIVGAEPPVHLNENYPTEETKEGYQRIYPINSRNEERVWRSSFDSGKEKVDSGELIISEGGTVYQIIDHEDKRETLFSNWTDSKFNAGVHGANLLSDLDLDKEFDYPKSIYSLETALWAQTYGEPNAVILDYFAGSGTTGHAVIKMNRSDGGKRKYILVEMGQYFHTVLKPRIEKIIYSEDWEDGKPISREGSSHAFKYMRLESYEDTLNNLKLKRAKAAQELLLDETAFGEDYLLHYMMDFESQDSLLDLERFDTPFDYQLQIASSTVGETEATPVDLVETFNYLLGFRVQSIRKFEEAVVVRGTTRDEKQVLVIWRTVAEMNNDQLNNFFEAHLAVESDEITDIYVNGDNNLVNIRPANQHWTVHLTEQSFHRLMFKEG